MHTRDDHVEAREEVLVAVEGAVFEDVDLDASEDAKGREPLVELVEDVELLAAAARVTGRARP